MKPVCVFACVLLAMNGSRAEVIELPTLASFLQISRMLTPVPLDRILSVQDMRVLHFGPDSTTPTRYQISDAVGILSDPRFDKQKPTVVYVHGYIELTTDANVLTIVQGYQRHGGYNILLLDWSNLAFGNYIAAGLNIKKVGIELGRATVKMVEAGLSLPSLHLVGHSMGSHVAAVASRLMGSNGLRVQRLTVLDPAFPGFYAPLAILDTAPVGTADAEFVDAIHTNGAWYGTYQPGGHVDFWPNGGIGKQPGCPQITIPLFTEDFCSHWRSWQYWTESLQGGVFLARRCDTMFSFEKGNCRNEEIGHMGLHASPQLRGNFYLRTASQSPFALGDKGLN